MAPPLASTSPETSPLRGPHDVCDRPRRPWLAGHGAVAAVLAVATALAVPLAAPRHAGAQAVAAPSEAAAGLDARSEDGASRALPLVREALAVRVDDGHAAVTYTHAFQNESTARLEGTYRIFAGEGATATGFAYYVGSERIVGEVFEREAARQVYEALTGLRRDPGLLEQTGEGAFSFRVFPIEPGETKRVEVTTARWLPRVAGAEELRVRLTRDDADVSVELRDARGVREVTSASHELEILAGDAGATRVRVKRPLRAGAGELVLRYRTEGAPLALSAALHPSLDGKPFVTATLATPPSQKRRAPHDVTLVLDRSGSMEGSALEGAKAAAQKVVARLGATDRVNVIAFDDGIDRLFPEPARLDDATRAKARRYIDSIHPRGGTDIAKALSAALGSQNADAQPNVVFFLTDGQSDGPTALAAAAADKSDVRLFTVGLGAGVDKALLSRLAATKHGRFSFVADTRAVEHEFAKVLAQLEEPVLTNLSLRVEGGALASLYPATLPDLFADDELRVFARLAGSAPATLVLEGTAGGERKVFRTPLDATHAPPRPFVARSWARARVDDLLEQTKSGGDTAGLEGEVVDLGLTYALVTPFTSFLAIPERELTKEARDATLSMRERRKKLLAANRDAASISRQLMPPGDPVLRVRAPRDARRVLALFPFGLTQELEWDGFTEQWATRFLVPADVPDGTFAVRVLIEHRDGRVEATAITYTIDSQAPELDVAVRVVPGGALLRVTSDEPLLEVRCASTGRGALATALASSASAQSYEGLVALLPGPHTLRVVATDGARNEVIREVHVEIPR